MATHRHGTTRHVQATPEQTTTGILVTTEITMTQHTRQE